MNIFRIQSLLKYLDNNYYRQITHAELEAISHSSYRNIQRVFLALTNETIGQYCTRLKIEQAYKLLFYTDLPILDIALQVGYENNQSLTKAFRNKLNLTPLMARQHKSVAFEEFITSAKLENLTTSFEYAYLQPIDVYAQLLINNNYNNDVINTFWREIEYSNINLQHYDSYGVIIDQPILSDPIKTRYEACVSEVVDKKPFYIKTIFGQWYAKYTHLDQNRSIEDTYRLIYQQWLNTQCYELDTTPIIEQYVTDQDIADKWSTFIFVPIKRKLSI